MNLTIRHRLFLSNLAAVFLAAVVASIGVVGFVGLAAPVLARLVGAPRLGRRTGRPDRAHRPADLGHGDHRGCPVPRPGR